ncbi:MAG: hypothetical protein V8R46_03865 [Eubacterium ramulus]
MTDAEKEKTVLFDESARYEFPKNIVRVTAGKGGEALLILGSEKTALVDCGMAYCADKLIEKYSQCIEKKKRAVWSGMLLRLYFSNAYTL